MRYFFVMSVIFVMFFFVVSSGICSEKINLDDDSTVIQNINKIPMGMRLLDLNELIYDIRYAYLSTAYYKYFDIDNSLFQSVSFKADSIFFIPNKLYKVVLLSNPNRKLETINKDLNLFLSECKKSFGSDYELYFLSSKTKEGVYTPASVVMVWVKKDKTVYVELIPYKEMKNLYASSNYDKNISAFVLTISSEKFNQFYLGRNLHKITSEEKIKHLDNLAL